METAGRHVNCRRWRWSTGNYDLKRQAERVIKGLEEAAQNVASMTRFDSKALRQAEQDDNPVEQQQEDEEKTIVSDEFLSMMTSGCTGVPNPAAKEAMREKLVALEAGWSGFRSQFNEKIQSPEESWQGWNLNSLLNFNSPSKAEGQVATETKDECKEATDPLPAVTPTTMGSTTTVLTTPPTRSTVKANNHIHPQMTPKAMFPEDPALPEVELIQAEDSIVGLIKSPVSMDAEEEVVLGVVRELERARRQTPRKDKTVDASHELIEKIVIGSTEHDVPLSLKNTLADISMIADGNNNSGNGNTSASSCSSRPSKQILDYSREDSEGGKVILDAAEWDPVDSSEAGEEVGEEVFAPVEVVSELPTTTEPQPGQQLPNKSSGFGFFKRKSRGKKKSQSPKSVLMEI